MEELNQSKATKNNKAKSETDNKFTVDLSKFEDANIKLLKFVNDVNNKKFGRKVNRNHILAFAISKLEDGDIKKVQEMNLSAKDMLDKFYLEHLEKTEEKITKEEFIIRNLKNKMH